MKVFLLSLGISYILLLFSILPLAFARYSSGISIRKIQSPRELYKTFQSWGRRADALHKNSIEAFSFYTPALLVAIAITIEYGEVLPDFVSHLSIMHPIFRLLYMASYLANLGLLRAICWGASSLFSLTIYIECVKYLISN